MGKTKYIFITGGVVSGLGKGITAASLGRLLKSRGLKVTAQKLDPYLNVDPGTMNPVQHGEVFVTDDGAETDLDLGHYERFIDESLSQNSNLTSGRVYWKVITDERKGVYGGQTIQIIPHVTNEIKRSIARNADTGADVCLVEIGGTVGDIESQPFLEAIRQFAVEAGRENCLFIHVTLVPYLAASDELKSKPTQHSVKEMLSIGINPDIIVCRTEHPLTDEIKHKISLFCNVDPECVIENNNCDILYAVPIMLHQQHMDDVVIRKLGIDCPGAPDLADWQEMLDALRNAAKRGVDVRLVLPGIPDKKLVFRLSRSYYLPLLQAGVRIFEFTPGFLHAKCWVSDDVTAVVGSINMDYRSLFLHFECGVLLQHSSQVAVLRDDVLATLPQCREVQVTDCRTSLPGTVLDSVLRLLSPLM